MKKIWIISILTLLFVLALCGCQNTTEDMNIDKDTLVKTQEIQVTRADKSDAIAILSEKSDIDNFINSFDWEHLEVAQLPHNSIGELVFILSRTDTIKFGETSSNGKLSEVAKISSYENEPYVTFSMSGISLDFQISKETQEYLHSFISQ